MNIVAEKIKEFCNRDNTVRIDTLHKGDHLVDCTGQRWVYDGEERDGSGCHYVDSTDGKHRTCFAGCAIVIKC